MKHFKTNIGSIPCPRDWSELSFSAYAKFCKAKGDSFTVKVEQISAITGVPSERLESLNAKHFVEIFNHIADAFGSTPVAKSGRPSFIHKGVLYAYRMHTVRQFSLMDKYKDFKGSAEDKLVSELAIAFIEKEQSWWSRLYERFKYGKLENPFMNRFNLRKEAIYAQSVQDVTDMVFFLKLLSNGYTKSTLSFLWTQTQAKILAADKLALTIPKGSGLITSFIASLTIGTFRRYLLWIQAQANSLRLSTGGQPTAKTKPTNVS